jgi:hypothetical protein
VLRRSPRALGASRRAGAARVVQVRDDDGARLRCDGRRDTLRDDLEAVTCASLEGADDGTEALRRTRQRLVARMLHEHLVAGREHRGIREEYRLRGAECGHHFGRLHLVVRGDGIAKLREGGEVGIGRLGYPELGPRGERDAARCEIEGDLAVELQRPLDVTDGREHLLTSSWLGASPRGPRLR